MRFQRQLTRRLLVAGLLLALALLATATAWFGESVWALTLAAAPAFIFATALNGAIRAAFELDRRYLDADVLQVRHRAYKHAYWIALLCLVFVATSAVGVSLSRQETLAIAVFVLLASALAPRMLMAWNLRDSDGRQ